MINLPKQRTLLVVLATTYGGLMLLGLVDNLRGPLFPSIIKHYQISSKTGSLIFAPSSLAALIINLFSPWWLRKIGAGHAMKLAILLMSLSGVIFAIGPINGWPFSMMITAGVLFGIGNGFCSISINVLLGMWSPIEKRRQFFGGLHAMYGLASLIAPLLPTLLTFWSRAFFIPITLAILLILPASLIPASRTEKSAEERNDPKMKLTFMEGIVFPALPLALYVAAEILVSTRLQQYLEQFSKLTYSSAAPYTFFFFVFLTIGRVSLIFLPSKLPSTTVLFSSLFISIVCCVMGFWSPQFFALSGLGMALFFPTFMDAITNRYGKNAGFYLAKCFTMMGVFISALHYVTGQLTDIYGIHMAMIPAPIFLIISLLLLFFQKKKLEPTPQPH